MRTAVCILFATLFLFQAPALFAQKIKRIDFYEVDQSVAEKYGSYTFKERIIAQYVCAKPIEGSQIANGANGEIKFQFRIDKKKSRTQIRCFTEEPKINRVRIVFEADSSERFYGCGEQFSHLLLNGKRIPIITEEQGIGRGDKPISKFTDILGIEGTQESSYFPLPYCISSAFYSLAVAGPGSHFPSTFDFSRAREIAVEVEHRYAFLEIVQAASFEELFVASYNENESKFQPKPDWTYGTILGIQGGANKVETILDSCISLGNPVTAIWIQDWCGRRKTRIGSQLVWGWKPDTLLYPDFKNWVKKMNSKGVKVMGYINPFLALNTPMYEEAKRKRFLVENPEGGVHIIRTGGFDAALVNIINTEAQNWLQQIIEKNLIGNGLNGWMADFGEWCPWFVQDSIYNSFKDYDPNNSAMSYIKYTAHNRFAVKWAEVNEIAVGNYPGEELFYFMRAGNSFSTLHAPMFWMGDQMVDWGENDGIKATVTALNSAAMSGIRNLHSDIGGYTTVENGLVKVVREKELFMRWTELNIFQPFYRTHEGVRPEANHQFYSDDSTMLFFARMGKIHLALKSYRKQYEDRLIPVPMIHPLLIDYPDDSVCFNLKYQFMYGKELMVAPVLDKGAITVNAYLPNGDWIELFSGKKYLGKNWHSIDAPIGKPPVFVKADSGWKDYFLELFKTF